MDYDGKYLKIRKALHEAGFDEFYQAGSVNLFHKMNIVAESTALGMRFWFCISGGYRMADEYYVISRKLDSSEPEKRKYCRNQQEMADQINAIRRQIEIVNKGKKGAPVKEELYIITSVNENVITDQRLAFKDKVPGEVIALLRSYAEKQKLDEVVDQIGKGDFADMYGYELGIDADFDEEGCFSAHCYIDETFDIYAMPMPERPKLDA